MKKQNAVSWLTVLTLFSCFGFGQEPVTQSVRLAWAAEFEGHAPCVSRDLLLACAGYKQTLSSLKVPLGLAIVGIEYQPYSREKRFAPAMVNESNPFIEVSAVGFPSKKIYLPIDEAGRSSVDGLSMSFPAGSVLHATYFAPGP